MYYDKRIEEVEAPAPVKLEPWQEQLLEAANVIRQYGWIQGWLGNEQNGYCALGAIARVTNTPYASPSIWRQLATHKFAGYIKTVQIGWWNDAMRRTKEGVIAALEGAAKAG